MSTVFGTRHVEFEGAHNFRDLGGYPSSRGGEVQWSMVYRAARLDQMTPRDLTTFESLGIRSVFDLRRDEERARHPDPVPSVQQCMISRVLQNGLLPDSATLVERDHGVHFLRDLYLGLLAHAGGEIGAVFRGMAAADGLPAVFHCTAGKDRTGVVAALLLSCLGVDRELVLDDFELTDEAVGQPQREEMFQRMIERGVGPEAAAGLLHASRESMATALDELDTRYGGVESYLRTVAGLDDDSLATLRERLLH